MSHIYPETECCDVAVVGAGPAGCSAATYLARAGSHVVLFERSKMPRGKPCGGALSERAMSYLGFPVPQSLVDCEVFGARAHFGDNTAEARLPNRIAVLVTRSEFDQFLLSRAVESGAEVIWEKATSISRTPDHVAVRTARREIIARCAIVCEGANRRLSRLAGPAIGPDQQSFCLQADIPVASPDVYADLKGVIDVYFGVVPWGYGWLFHHGSYYSVGIGALCSKFHDPLSAFHRFVRARRLARSDIRPRGHFLPRGGISRPICADRIMLAGDAASFVDPFYGEGMAYAIRSGQLAAQTARAAMQSNDFSRSRLAEYEHLCREEFGRNLRHALILTELVHRCPRPFIEMLSTDERALAKYLEIPSATLSYGRYIPWLLARAPLSLLRSIFRACC